MSEISPVNVEKLVGVEVSTLEMKAVCLDKNGKLIDAVRTMITRDRETFAQLIEFISALKSRFGSTEKIGVAVPGLVHEQTKRVAFSTFIPEHEQIDFLGEMESATGLKFTVENDANSAAFGEFRLGAGRGSKSMFYATLGTGIGGALIFDGKIWRGASGFAGEFGHIAITADGTQLEDVASSANIIRRTKTRFNRDHTSSLSGMREEDITLADVIRAARENDNFAQLMLERTGAAIGTAIAGVINLLNIEKIVVGGEIMQAEHLVLDAIIRRARELSFAPSFAAAEIAEGELGENAAAVGVALLAAE